jgi:hypothetical protein
MTRQSLYTELLTATRVHGLTHEHQCQRCGITITEGRSYRYDNTCRDCAPWLGVTRKKAA